MHNTLIYIYVALLDFDHPLICGLKYKKYQKLTEALNFALSLLLLQNTEWGSWLSLTVKDYHFQALYHSRVHPLFVSQQTQQKMKVCSLIHLLILIVFLGKTSARNFQLITQCHKSRQNRF